MLKPTKRGVSLLVVGAVLYGMAWQISIGWFYIANALVWAAVLVNVPLPLQGVRGLSARRALTTPDGGRATEVFEGDSVRVSMDLENRSFLPKPLVAMRELCPLAEPGNQERGFLLATVPPRRSAPATYDVRCYKRGAYEFGPIEVQSSAPFGLFRARRLLAAPLDVLVYPEVHPMDTTVAPGSSQGTDSRLGPAWSNRRVPGLEGVSERRCSSPHTLEELSQTRPDDGQRAGASLTGPGAAGLQHGDESW